MPPRKAKQNLSTASEEAIVTNAVAASPAMEETHTPEHDPMKRGPASITAAQKQVLIDNLQQEGKLLIRPLFDQESALMPQAVTDRARRLRTQYAQQAQNLRTRLEMRINRIPTALRKRKMQDLIEEHTRKNEPQSAAPLPVQAAKASAPEVEPTINKSLKRQR